MEGELELAREELLTRIAELELLLRDTRAGAEARIAALERRLVEARHYADASEQRRALDTTLRNMLEPTKEKLLANIAKLERLLVHANHNAEAEDVRRAELLARIAELERLLGNARYEAAAEILERLAHLDSDDEAWIRQRFGLPPRGWD